MADLEALKQKYAGVIEALQKFAPYGATLDAVVRKPSPPFIFTRSSRPGFVNLFSPTPHSDQKCTPTSAGFPRLSVAKFLPSVVSRTMSTSW